MITTTTKRKCSTDNKPQETKPNTTNNKKTERKIPPFVKFTKVNKSPDSPLFKVGNTKTWNNQTWHFCDCLNHRGGIHQHTHPADACWTQARWIKTKEKESKANANIAEELPVEPSNKETSAQEDNENKETPNTDIIGLLAAVLNMTGDNELAKDLIADALNAIRDS